MQNIFFVNQYYQAHLSRNALAWSITVSPAFVRLFRFWRTRFFHCQGDHPNGFGAGIDDIMAQNYSVGCKK